MKNKYNTLHKYIFDYSEKEYTKETVEDLFSSVLKPLLSTVEAEACILLKLKDLHDKKSLLTRLKFSNREIYGFCDDLKNFKIKNFQKENLWNTTQFIVILSQRYSAALIWDYSISENSKYAKVCFLLNSKIVSDISKKIFDNSSVEDYKQILLKYNADRRENSLLNSAVSLIAGNLNDKNEEILFHQKENKSLINSDDTLKTAEIVSNKAKFIAHEIKNSLSVINLYSAIVQKRLNKIDLDDETSKSTDNALTNIKNAAENISSLISDLRCLSAPYITETNIKELIENIVIQCSEKAKNAQADISVINADSKVFGVDKVKLECALINIIYNAIEALQNGGMIEVYTELDDKFYNIFIKNNGAEIPKEIQNKIFEPEFTTKEKGNGLGLAICKSSLEQTGGTISLVSSDKTATVFKISLAIQ